MSNLPINIRAERDARQYVQLAKIMGITLKNGLREAIKEFNERYRSEILHHKTSGKKTNLSSSSLRVVK